MKSTFTLPNGLNCVCEERPGSGYAVMQVMIKAGSPEDPLPEAGLTSMTQGMMFAGTTTRPPAIVSDEIERMGSVLDGSTGRLETRFSVQALTRHVEASFSVLADVVRNPLFDADELENAKAHTVQALTGMGRKASARAGMKFIETVFAGQAVAIDPMGKPETVSGFTADHLRRRHAELLADPSRIVVSFAGDVTADQMRVMVERHFGDVAPAAVPSVPPADIVFRPGDSREAAAIDQLNLKIGFAAPSLRSDDRHAAVLLNELLGAGISAPLFQEVREKRGLVYRINSDFTPLETAGIFSVSAGVSKGHAGEMIETTLEVLGQYARNGFSDEAMAAARERIVRESREREESVAHASTVNAVQMTLFGRVSDSRTLEAKLARVTSDDLRRLLGTMLEKGDYALSAVGPLEGMPEPQAVREKMQEQVRGLVLPDARTLPALHADFSAAARKAPKAPDALPRLTVLPNGLKVMTLEREGNLTCGAWVGVGSAAETPELAGATHMNEHMMFKGTASYPPGAINEMIEGELRGAVNAFTSKDKTCYVISNLDAGGLARAIDVCGEMVFRASLAREEFEGVAVTAPDGTTVPGKGERDVVIEELRMYNDDPADRQQNAMTALAWPDHALGRPIIGTEQSLRAMDVGMLAAWRDACYVPNNVVIAAAGPVRHEDVVALAQEKFGDIPAREIPRVEKPVYAGGTGHYAMDGVDRCSVQLAMECPASGESDVMAFRALAAVMGGSESSRLVRTLVDEERLAESIAAGVQANAHAGLFIFKASTTPDKARPLIVGFYRELRAVAGDLTNLELDKIKAGVEIALLSGFENNQNACSMFATDALMRGHVVSPKELAAKVEALTVDDLKCAACRLLQSNPTLATMSPPGTDPRQLPAHAEVVAMRDGAPPPPPHAVFKHRQKP